MMRGESVRNSPFSASLLLMPDQRLAISHSYAEDKVKRGLRRAPCAE